MEFSLLHSEASVYISWKSFRDSSTYTFYKYLYLLAYS